MHSFKNSVASMLLCSGMQIYFLFSFNSFLYFW